MKNKFFHNLQGAGQLMFVFLTMTFVVETLRMMLGLPPLGASPIIGLLISFYWAWKFHRKEIWSTFIFLIILGYCGWAAFLFYDLSFDGQWYHQDAIIHLRNGWNPFWDAPLAHEAVSGFNANYVNHYAKAPWTLASALYQCLPYIQWSKAGNLMWLAISFLITLGALFRWTQRPFVSAMIALLLALSPVAVGQSLSFYVDGQLYSLMLILIIFLADIFIDGPSFYRWFSVGVAFIYLSNIKFTGLVYASIFFFGLFMVVVFKHKKIWWNVLSRGVVIFILAFFVVGHCTYVRNWKDKGHPFFPLMGEGNEGTRVAQVHYPKNFFDMNRWQRWNAATFHYPGYTSPDEFPSHPKKLFHRKTVRESILYYRLHQPMVIAPLGPFSAELILLLIPLFLFLVWRNKKGLFPWLLGGILVSVCIQPEFWHYRYAPHQLFIYGFVLLFGLLDDSRWIQRYSLIIILGFLTNFSIIGYEYYQWNRQGTRAIRAEKRVLKNNTIYIKKGWLKSMEIRLAEWKVKTIPYPNTSAAPEWKSFAADDFSDWKYIFVP